jgi:hypothetical protein
MMKTTTKTKSYIAVAIICLVSLVTAAHAADWQYQWFCVEKGCGWQSTVWQSFDEANKGGKFHELMSKGHRWSLRSRRIN